MDDAEKMRRIQEEPDFIGVRRFDYSLKALLERYPDEVPDGLIAQALMIPERDVEKTYDLIVLKLRDLMGVRDV